MQSRSDLVALRFAVAEEASGARTAGERATLAGGHADAAAAAAPGRAARACAPGCAHCCSLRVEVAPFEADALAARLRREGRVPELRERIRSAAAFAAGTRRHRMRCVLLDDQGRCSVYSTRPLRCRAHTSSSLFVCREVEEGRRPTGAVPGEAGLRGAVEAILHGMGAEPEALEELHAALRDRLRADGR